MKTSWLTGILVAGTVFLASGIASAAAFTSGGTCSGTDVSPNATACFGQVLPRPVNDSESLLNDNTFGGDTGLFGYTDWDFIAKQEKDGTLEGIDIGLSVTPLGEDVLSGVWDVNDDAFDGYSVIAIIIKASTTLSAYLFDATLPTGGGWSTAALTTPSGNQPGISHFSIYGIAGDGPSVPEPASLALLGFGVLGLGWVLRRPRRCEAD